ncbi:MAG: hypothetical protein GY810_20965 [Aureispira sp.]|nr:hypothetical protein [Aureispira sp.]
MHNYHKLAYQIFSGGILIFITAYFFRIEFTSLFWVLSIFGGTVTLLGVLAIISSKIDPRYKLGIPLFSIIILASNISSTIEFELFDRLLYYNYMNRHAEALNELDSFVKTSPRHIFNISYSHESSELEIYSDHRSNTLLNTEQKDHIRQLMNNLNLKKITQSRRVNHPFSYQLIEDSKTYQYQTIDTSINSSFNLKLNKLDFYLTQYSKSKNCKFSIPYSTQLCIECNITDQFTIQEQQQITKQLEEVLVSQITKRDYDIEYTLYSQKRLYKELYILPKSKIGPYAFSVGHDFTARRY